MKQTVILAAHLIPPSVSSPVAVVERWERSLGQAVMVGDPLATLRAGDTMFLIVSPAFGVLTKKCVLPGEAVEAGEPVAVLGGVSAPLAGTPPDPVPAPPPYMPGGPERVHTLSAMQLALGEHHRRSLRDTPHLYTVTTADVSEALRYIAKAGRGETVSGAAEKLALLPFVLCTVATSLTRFPELNAERTGHTEVRYKQYVHLGIETHRTDETLLVPVLRDVNRKSVLAVAREWAQCEAGIAAGTLAPSDVSGATFTVSQTPRVLYRIPILHRPLTGHLSFGKPTSGQIYLCLAYDAAVVSGAAAESFLADVSDSLAEARFLFA